MTKKPELKLVVVKTVADIRKVIAPFKKDIKHSKVEIKSEIQWTEEENGKATKYSVTASAPNEDVSLKELLIDEFSKVKNKKEIWDKLQHALVEDAYSASLPTVNIDDMYMSVDNIIKHRLAGKREGLTVVWHLDNVKHIFDPFTGELREENAKSKLS